MRCHALPHSGKGFFKEESLASSGGSLTLAFENAEHFPGSFVDYSQGLIGLKRIGLLRTKSPITTMAAWSGNSMAAEKVRGFGKRRWSWQLPI